MSVRAEAPVAEEEHDASHEGTAGAHSGAHRAVRVSSVVASARSLLGSGAESLRKAVGGTRELTQEDLDKIVAAPIHIRWEIVRLAELRELGASIEARWPFIAALLANQESNLPIAAEYLKKRKRVAGDTHLLSDAPANGTTVEYITDFINGEGTPEDLLFRLINDSVTDHNAVQLLLARDVEVNNKWANGLTFLHIAAIKGDAKLSEMLAGYTPLHYACLAGQDEAAMMLRRCDTDVTIVNRANHTALQCAASTGNRALAVRIDRAIGVREEAVLRAKRFYVHLFEGNEDYWKDPVEDRCPDFFTGRLLAAILILKPRWLKGKRARRQLIPADLGKLERLGRKAFGKKWEIQMEFDYTHPKLMPNVSKYIFKGLLHPLKVQSMLNAGKAKYLAMVREREEAAAEKTRRENIEEFVTWMRDPEPTHRAAIMLEVFEVANGKTPITLTAMQDIIERDTPLMVQEFDTLHSEDRACIDYLWRLWEENGRRLFGQEPPASEGLATTTMGDWETEATSEFGDGSSTSGTTTATSAPKKRGIAGLLSRFKRK